jgi:hypothetical protein
LQVPALRLVVLRPGALQVFAEADTEESMSILDPKFRYVPAADTDLRKTFARIRKAQREKAEAEKRDEIERIAKIRPMTRRAG